MNQLIQAGCQVQRSSVFAETFAQESEASSEKTLIEQPKSESQTYPNSEIESEQAQVHRYSQKETTSQSPMTNVSQDNVHQNNPQVLKNNQQVHDQVTTQNAEAASQCPKIPIVSNDSSPNCHHERLDSEIGKGASLAAAGDTRGNRPSHGRRSEGGSHDLREGSSGPDIRRCVEFQPGVDSMVPAALSEEQQARSPEDDQVHQAQDREHGREPSSRPPDPSDAKEPCGSQDNALASEGQGTTKSRDASRGTGVNDRGAMGRIRECSDHKPPGAHGHDGECSSADLGPPCTNSCDGPSVSGDLSDHANRGRVERSLESMKAGAFECDLALSAGEMDSFCETNPNQERTKFWDWVRIIEHELEQVSQQVSPGGSQLNLLEVFCSNDSNLTHQVNMLGGKAIRFGIDQGDLHTHEGRVSLFKLLCRFRPEHVWVSPVCKPWSKWSIFNSHRSLESWDRINAERQDMLVQVALCFVMCRHQVRHQRHMHWEQPKGSVMMTLPYIQEIFQYMKQAQPDLCNAGDLRDPITQQHMKKGLNITTTSLRMFEELDPLRCTGDHDHQPIEGRTHANGQSIARSAFSEVYPRRFARRVAKTMLKKSFPKEKPFGMIADPALALFDAICALSDRPAKRYRAASSRSSKTKAADRDPDANKTLKRAKTTESISNSNPSPNEDEQKAIELIMSQIEPLLPRVGKKIIDQPKIQQMLQFVFPTKEIKKIIACKGTERTMGPPNDLNCREAPFRRSIMRLRSNGKVVTDAEWERYENLSNRQIIRKSHPCRVNITVFAANPPCKTPEKQDPEANQAELSPSRTDGCDSVQIPAEDPPTETEEKHEETETTEQPGKSLESTESQGNEAHGPRFLALTKEEQSMLKRAHKNLCHPSPEQFSAVLRMQKVRPEVHQAVFDMQCSTCASMKRPKIARPSTIKHELDFNDKVFLDCITWTNKSNRTFHFYHIIDQATNFHVAAPAPSRTAENAVRCVLESWMLWAGPPNTMVTDSATEFVSDTFAQFQQRNDIKSTTIAPHAHWQNGRCERHGEILQNMLNKLDKESPIESYEDLQQALAQSTHAKNTLSIRRGFSPEILVFGKSSRLPGSISSSTGDSSLASADRDDGQGIEFRKNLALRERARVAFHQADNDAALRRASLRRSRPSRDAYQAGEWIMMWQPNKQGGHWFGPLKVVTQEGDYSIWATSGGKLYRRALEHIRPVCSQEAHQLPADDERADMPSPTTIPSTTERITQDEIPSSNNEDNPNTSNNPDNILNPASSENSSQSHYQPDVEPEVNTPSGSITLENPNDPAINTPIPENSDDDSLITTHLLCCEDEIMHVDPVDTPCAWRCELELPSSVQKHHVQSWSADDILMATTEKKQRTEVKLTLLSPEEQDAFKAAKETEIQNWLKTGTVSKILRNKLAPEQILRCRWILVWKPLEGIDEKEKHGSKLSTHKPKARLVVLGYLDPKITEVPRDSPTLGRQSKMLLLQLISSQEWSLGSFDIRAAFLQGKPQQDRVIGIEPVTELIKAMQLKPDEICKLDKSAYGLIDAPYLWFRTLQEELVALGFIPSPFDPCVFLLREPKSQRLSGVLGIHVDDGIHGGDQYFHQQISKLEAKYPFGAKKSKQFTFTGIDLQQHTDNSIELSQSKYIRNINPITLSTERRADENAKVTEPERHQLRGLIGSLQYAAVHTRPDLSSSLSQLQSQVNSATVSTL